MDRKALIDKLAAIATAPTIGHKIPVSELNSQPIITEQNESNSTLLQSFYDFLQIESDYQVSESKFL